LKSSLEVFRMSPHTNPKGGVMFLETPTPQPMMDQLHQLSNKAWGDDVLKKIYRYIDVFREYDSKPTHIALGYEELNMIKSNPRLFSEFEGGCTKIYDLEVEEVDRSTYFSIY